jgi:hypothetical protein
MHNKMQRVLLAFLLVVVFASIGAQAQSAAPAIVTGPELTKILPTTYFFRGLSATVQERNSSALKFSDGFYVLAGLVDTSGYSSDIKQKYAGFFITEKPLIFAGKTLPPGEYGLGFNAEGKFHILDVAANELLAADAPKDTKMARPVPLKFVVENGEIRLYQGRTYVGFAAQ